MASITQQVILDVDSSQGQKSVNQLRKDVKEYTNQLLNTKEGTEDYARVANNLRQAQNDLGEATRALQGTFGSLSNILADTMSVAQNVTAGFAAAQGAAALFGSSGEALQKTLVKVQASIALMQGLQGLQGLGRSFTNLVQSLGSARTAFASFNAVVATNPLLPIVAVLAAVVGGLKLLEGASWSAASAVSRLNDEWSRMQTEGEKADKAVARQIALLRAMGTSEETLAEIQANRHRQAIQQTNERIAALDREIAAYERASKRAYGWVRESNKYIKALRQQREEAGQAVVDRQEKLDDIWLQNQIRFLEKERKNDASANAAKIAASGAANDALLAQQQKQLEDELKQVKTIQEAISAFYRSEYEQRLYDLKKSYDEERALLIKHGQDVTYLDARYQKEVNDAREENEKNINDKLAELRRKDLENLQRANELQAIEAEKGVQRLEATLLAARRSLVGAESTGDSDSIVAAQNRVNQVQELLAQARLDQEAANIGFFEEYRDRLQTILEEDTLNAETRIEFERELQDTINEIDLAGLDYRQSLISAEIDALANQRDAERAILEERKKQRMSFLTSLSSIASSAVDIIGSETAAGKAIAVAGATIDTYRAAVQAMASTPGGPIIKAAAMTATIATGLASVKKILSTKVPGTNDSQGATSVTNAPSISAGYVPQYTEDVQRLTSTEQQQLNQRVYVVETDIENALDNSRTRVSENTF